MFYKQLQKLVPKLGESFVVKFDFWLATLPAYFQKDISVSSVATRFKIKHSIATKILDFAADEGILKMKYTFIYSDHSTEKQLTGDSLISLLNEVSSMIHCQNDCPHHLLSTKDVYVSYDRVLAPDITQEEMKQIISNRLDCIYKKV